MLSWPNLAGDSVQLDTEMDEIATGARRYDAN